MDSIVLCLPDSLSLLDPDPEQTHKRGVRLVNEWDENVIGVAGWSSGGLEALALAVEHEDLARLVIMSTPYPAEPNADSDLTKVMAKTLLLFGSADPSTGHSHGSRWQKQLPNARLEMVPGAGHDLLAAKWGRVLSHLAPRRRVAGNP